MNECMPTDMMHCHGTRQVASSYWFAVVQATLSGEQEVKGYLTDTQTLIITGGQIYHSIDLSARHDD